MSTQSKSITNSWELLYSGSNIVLIQANGILDVFLGATPPQASDGGFVVRSGEFLEVSPGDYGGAVYVRSGDVVGGLTYAIQ